ncbi:MAG: proline racemase family protein [Capsulimonadales bacterium]|nr:proline racemase family protein [Capsulimonadales bacterium]
MSVRRIHVIDSHTEGEPTRVVVDGGPGLGDGPLAERRDRFRERFDGDRTAIVCEPRGSDVLVGALLTEPAAPDCIIGVIFFNNVGYLGMCGHGLIGVMATLAHLERIGPGTYRIDTPAGVVTATLHDDGGVSVRNVPSYRLAKDVPVRVEGYGTVYGDIAYGGNWFFLVSDHGQELSLTRAEELTDFTWRIRRSLAAQGITGQDGAEIDHIELFAPSPTPGAHSRNFVLCPGKAYDRSPCGTGTSAKLACLFADGKLAEGQVWEQESLVGSRFRGSVVRDGDRVLPTITGRAYITADTTLILHPDDPFRQGIRA